jgi:hypothetical protein
MPKHAPLTPAEVVMGKLAFHSDKDPDDGMLAYRKIKDKGIELLNKDEEEGNDYLDQQLESGNITKDQKNKIHRAVIDKNGNKLTSFQSRFKQYGVTRVASSDGSYAAFKIYEKMTPEQKSQTIDILMEKAQNAWKRANDPDIPEGQMSGAQAEMLREWKKYIPELEIE